ncbi:DUF975 family protein [Enterococcus sp. LJL90]
MLRKELKELAQRSLKGKYGKWSVFIIIPFAIMAITFFFSFIFLGIASILSYTDDYSSGYEDSYYEEDYDSDFWDDYWDDDYYTYEESSYTPAYNYGYALGYQAGYLQGWQDQEDGTEYWGTLSSDQAILANIEGRPVQYLGSDDFNEGTLDAYYYSYDEAWEDYLGYSLEGNSYQLPNSAPALNQVSPMNNGFEPYFPESGYTEMPRRSNPFLSFLISFIFIAFIIAVALVYNCVYVPLLRWTGIDTIDGENFNFKDSLKKIRKQFGVVLWSNVKIAIFTTLWSFLFVIPGLVKTASYSMTNYLLKREPDLNSSKAIALSEELMRGYKIEYLIFNLSFFWWFLAQAYSLGFASFYVMPYYYTSEAAFFDEIYFEKRRYTNSELAAKPVYQPVPKTDSNSNESVNQSNDSVVTEVSKTPEAPKAHVIEETVVETQEESEPTGIFERPSYSFSQSAAEKKELTEETTQNSDTIETKEVSDTEEVQSQSETAEQATTAATDLTEATTAEDSATEETKAADSDSAEKKSPFE